MELLEFRSLWITRHYQFNTHQKGTWSVICYFDLPLSSAQNTADSVINVNPRDVSMQLNGSKLFSFTVQVWWFREFSTCFLENLEFDWFLFWSLNFSHWLLSNALTNNRPKEKWFPWSVQRQCWESWNVAVEGSLLIMIWRTLCRHDTSDLLCHSSIRSAGSHTSMFPPSIHLPLLHYQLSICDLESIELMVPWAIEDVKK